ncbi:MAG: PIG-L deacetylase family protein [Candidatus Latescibacteria bacterium]|nr:PIG-L deacetylase family protein [Candidatus Latescibacterota bacterium]MDP7448279.1 PIG-L deacetylase family protein [Candidatus Latescibacterota bacterium]HJP29451.1 PIG-L deacetylase family protein [Candidatus Latescibacterota bacterium]
MSDLIREGRRVLVFSAHAADFCSRAGGTVARLVDAGGTVHIHGMSYGEKCESPALWAQEPPPSIQRIKEIRGQEMTASASVLGATIDCLDWGDSPLVVGVDRQQHLLELFREFQPDLVLTHWKDDVLHPDHMECTRAVIWASRYCFRPGLDVDHPPCPSPQVALYETTLGTAPVAGFLPNLFVDISEVQERKTDALRHLAAQPDLAERYATLAAYRAMEAQSTAWMKGCRFAEAFVRLGTEAAGFSGPTGFGP